MPTAIVVEMGGAERDIFDQDDARFGGGPRSVDLQWYVNLVSDSVVGLAMYCLIYDDSDTGAGTKGKPSHEAVCQDR